MIDMHKILTLSLLITCSAVNAQDKSPAQKFWNTLQEHCGNAYEGSLAIPEEDEQFGGKRLVMHVRSCSETEIRVPFFVGDDKSRTWVFTFENGVITLKHDHRHEDGTEDKVTQYGGTASNSGMADIQFFPADQKTATLLPRATTNIWWVTISDTTFTYNLRRLNSDTVFKVEMDLSQTIETPEAPWGWKEQ
jgi:hypothetical protein